jgi:hypothetical protein
MVVHMRRPRTVEGYKPCSVHGAHKDVLRDKITFAPSKQLFSSLQTMHCRVPALTHMHKPIPVRVIAMFEPFVDEHVGRVVRRVRSRRGLGLYWGIKTELLLAFREKELCGNVSVWKSCENCPAQREVTVKSPAQNVVRVPGSLSLNTATTL